MKRKLVGAAAAVFLLPALVAGCGSPDPAPAPEDSPAAEAPETDIPDEPEPEQDPSPAPQEEWDENVFASESGVTCAFFFRDDGAVNEYICYLPEPSFDTTDAIGTPIDCEGRPYVLDALIDSEMESYCASEPILVGLVVAPGETQEQASVACSGVEDELQCSFPYWEKGMGIEVSSDGFIAYMQDDDSHDPGSAEGKEYFLPIPYRPTD